MLEGFAEADPWIERDLVGGHAVTRQQIQSFPEKNAYLNGDVIVFRFGLHRLRSTLHVHADVAGSGFSDDLPHLCIGAVRGDVVDNGGPGGQCLAGDAWLLGVNGENQFRSLGQALTEKDSFAFTFQMTLDEVKAGHLDGQPYTFEVSIGLLNLENAKEEGFIRGTGTDSPNLVEWDYFPDTGFGATVSPALASSKSEFSAGFTFPAELTKGKVYTCLLYTSDAADE